MPVLLTAKGRHEAFCQQYIVDLNGTQAAIRCGYKESSAHSVSSRLLKNVKVAERIEELKAERCERTKIDADWLLTRLAAEATADLAELFDEDNNVKPVHEWPLLWRQGLVVGMDVTKIGDGDIPGYITKPRISDRLHRLKLIGDHIGVQAFKQNIEVNAAEAVISKMEQAMVRAAEARLLDRPPPQRRGDHLPED